MTIDRRICQARVRIDYRTNIFLEAAILHRCLPPLVSVDPTPWEQSKSRHRGRTNSIQLLSFRNSLAEIIRHRGSSSFKGFKDQEGVYSGHDSGYIPGRTRSSWWVSKYLVGSAQGRRGNKPIRGISHGWQALSSRSKESSKRACTGMAVPFLPT